MEQTIFIFQYQYSYFFVSLPDSIYGYLKFLSKDLPDLYIYIEFKKIIKSLI